MALEEDHGVTELSVICPGGQNPVASILPDASHLYQSLALTVEHIQRSSAEVGYDPLGQSWANPFHESRSEETFDAICSAWLHRLKRGDFKAWPMPAMVGPRSLQVEYFARTNASQGADRDWLQLGIGLRLQSHDRERAVVGSVDDRVNGAAQ